MDVQKKSIKTFDYVYRQKAPIHIEKTSLSNQTAEILDLSIKECGCVYAYEKAPESKLVNEAEVWVRESKGAMTMFHRASLEVYRCVKCGRYHYKHDMLDEKREIWPEDAKIEPEDDLPILSLEDIKKAEGEVVQSLIQDKGIEQSRYHSMEGLGDELS